MSEDVVERAQAWIDDVAPMPLSVHFYAADEILGMVTGLVAEVEQLRAGGPWVGHIERERAMKRERDGECICNRGPDTDGPDEFCPWHGRKYQFLVDELARLSAMLAADAEADR